jgi:mannosyltransferase OCH1-like enzyme
MPIPKIFYQSWCNKLNYASKIPDMIFDKTILNIPKDCIYKCFTLNEARNYLLEKWGKEYAELFDNYKNIPHKIDLWRYCILYDTGGTYMDADCELLSKIDFLYQHTMVFTTNDRKVKDIFNGFIMVEKGNIVIKEMIDYMINVWNSLEDDYYYNCKELYTRLNKYIDIDISINDYNSQIGNVCLLVDKCIEGRYYAFYKDTNVLVETNSFYPYP